MDKATFDAAMTELLQVSQRAYLNARLDSGRYVRALSQPEILDTPPAYAVDALAEVGRIRAKYLEKLNER